jgi:hypothetical protein
MVWNEAVIIFCYLTGAGFVVAVVDGKGGGIRVGSKMGCNVTLLSGDACLGSSIVLLVLVVVFWSFAYLGFLGSVEGGLAFQGGVL